MLQRLLLSAVGRQCEWIRNQCEHSTVDLQSGIEDLFLAPVVLGDCSDPDDRICFIASLPSAATCNVDQEIDFNLDLSFIKINHNHMHSTW